MYRDSPKSPNFTQSTVDTKTFLAAMSLKKTKQLKRIHEGQGHIVL